MQPRSSPRATDIYSYERFAILATLLHYCAAAVALAGIYFLLSAPFRAYALAEARCRRFALYCLRAALREFHGYRRQHGHAARHT